MGQGSTPHIQCGVKQNKSCVPILLERSLDRKTPYKRFVGLSGLADFEHLGTTGRALAGGCGLAVLHSCGLSVLNFSLGFALYAVSFHVQSLLES